MSTQQRKLDWMDTTNAQRPRALTIDAWWAWAIAYGTKRVENRSWRTNYRGPLYIHAGLTTKRDEEAKCAIHAIDPLLIADWPQAAATVDSLRGKIVAVCDLVDCVHIRGYENAAGVTEIAKSHGGPWAFGPWCWLLENVRLLEQPIPAMGKQGLWVPTIARTYCGREREVLP